MLPRRILLRMPAARLTYCGNVHAADTLGAWLANLDTWVVPIAAGAARPFGLGVFWPQPVLDEIGGAGSELARVRAALAQRGLEVVTVNAFPVQEFHAQTVKQRVYAPDWASEERVLYTRQAAELAAALARPGAEIAVSTLPLGFGQAELRLCARNLARAASHLADLEARTGVRIVLSLEPEPDCLLETVAASVRFLEEWLFREGAWVTVPEATLRRHLGLCVDLCHLAVVREDPLAAARLCAERGIAVGKIQVSSCLELRDPAALDALLAYDEPRYLHQTRGGNGLRALDLAEVRARRAEFAAAGVLRTHFHLPVFFDAPGALGSTRAELERALRGWPRPLPLLEVETYTWSVLPEFAPGPAACIAGIRRELEFVAALISS